MINGEGGGSLHGLRRLVDGQLPKDHNKGEKQSEQNHPGKEPEVLFTQLVLHEYRVRTSAPRVTGRYTMEAMNNLRAARSVPVTAKRRAVQKK